jgi:hypothetical protein
VTRRGGIVTSVRGEAALGRGKGGDDVSWADINLTGSKNKKIHAVGLATTWTVKI